MKPNKCCDAFGDEIFVGDFVAGYSTTYNIMIVGKVLKFIIDENSKASGSLIVIPMDLGVVMGMVMVVLCYFVVVSASRKKRVIKCSG